MTISRPPKPPGAGDERISDRRINSVKYSDPVDPRKIYYQTTSQAWHRPIDFAAWKAGTNMALEPIDLIPVVTGQTATLTGGFFETTVDRSDYSFNTNFADGGIVRLQLTNLTIRPQARVEALDSSIWIRGAAVGLDLEYRYTGSSFEIYKHVLTDTGPKALVWDHDWLNGTDFNLAPNFDNDMAFDSTVGDNNTGWRAELTSVGGTISTLPSGRERQEITETITGKTVAVRRDPASGYTRDAVYPIVIDATYGAETVGQDGHDDSGTWNEGYSSNWYFQGLGQSAYAAGLKWDSVEIDASSTITSATIKVYHNGKAGGNYPLENPNIYADDVTNPPDYQTSDLPTDITRTTGVALADITVATESSYISWDVTVCVQEVVDNGFASGNAMRFGVFADDVHAGANTTFDREDGGTNAATLEAVYTAAAAGVPPSGVNVRGALGGIQINGGQIA